MTDAKRPHVPIGYWIKKADELLTLRINEAQQENGLSRLEWLVLNVVHERGSASFQSIADALSPFSDSAALVEAIERFVQREVFESEGAGSTAYRLTSAGRRLHAAALRSQERLRTRAFDGISEDEYTATIRVLQRVVKNLEDAPASGPRT